MIPSCKNAPNADATARHRRAAPGARPARRISGRARRTPSAVGASTSSRAACAASARGTASRTSARSSRTRSRRPTSWRTPPTRATTPSCSTSSATCSSRSTSSRCCSRSAAPGDLAAVAEHCRQKLIRRHPHVFGDAEVADAGEVLRNWDQIKREEPGRERRIFGEVPENLPGAAATRARSSAAPRRGFDFEHVPYDAARRARGARAAQGAREALPRGRRRAVRGRQRRAQAKVDPSSRCARAERFRGRVEAPRPRRSVGRDWTISPTRSCYYAQARLAEKETPMSQIERSTPARSSTPRATRPSRSRSGCAPAPPAAPPCRRAPRPASSRPSSCATAASRGGGKGVTKAVANVNGEIAEAVAGSTRATRRRSTAR